MAIQYAQPSNLKIKYQLEGLDAVPNVSANPTVAQYTNIPGGSYEFVVTVLSENGLEIARKTITIVVKPPFYNTWWFRVCIFVGLVSCIGFIVQFFNKQHELEINLLNEEKNRHAQEKEFEQKEVEFKHQIAQIEVTALRAQMNPHFIFNCLNSIQYFTAKNDAESASNYLSKFSKLIRLVLENSRSERVTLQNEIETLRLYIEMEAMRFLNKLKYKISIDPDIDQESIQIPPLLLQPFVENAIWHGLMHKEDGGTIWVDITNEEIDILEVKITDDGVGRQKSAEFKSKTATKNKSFGMKLTAERIELINHLYDSKTQTQIIDLKDESGNATGTQVIVKIPI